jgi:hypothetical protein
VIVSPADVQGAEAIVEQLFDDAHGVVGVAISVFPAIPSALTTENKNDNEKKVAIICFEKNFIIVLKIVFSKVFVVKAICKNRIY